MTIVESTPVLAGVCATDPNRSIPKFLQQLKDLGFCGVQNFPTVGLIDGTFRKNLEATGMSYQAEVEMIRTARQMDLLTVPYVFNVDEAERMTKAGADIVVVHLGLTTGGSIGSDEGGVTLDDCVQTVETIKNACVKIEPDIIVLCHGGPISGESCCRMWRRNLLMRHAHRRRRNPLCFESGSWHSWFLRGKQYGKITSRSRYRAECAKVQEHRAPLRLSGIQNYWYSD